VGLQFQFNFLRLSQSILLVFLAVLRAWLKPQPAQAL
jgi:hypothetical protein